MRAAMIETETREEVAQEMEERMQLMDKMYRDRMNREVTLFYDPGLSAKYTKYF